MEVIRFVLSSFWAWLGTVILIAVMFNGIKEMVKAIIPRRTVKISRKNSFMLVTIENATDQDIDSAVSYVRLEGKEIDTND